MHKLTGVLIGHCWKISLMFTRLFALLQRRAQSTYTLAFNRAVVGNISLQAKKKQPRFKILRKLDGE